MNKQLKELLEKLDAEQFKDLAEEIGLTREFIRKQTGILTKEQLKNIIAELSPEKLGSHIQNKIEGKNDE